MTTKLIGLLLTALLVSTVGWTQSFQFRARVDAVSQSGFHRIQLSPDLVGHLNASLTDIRLYDEQQHEVPYVLIQQQPRQTESFVDYDVVSRKSLPNVSTTLVIRNQAKASINSLGLVIKNTNVGKKARLSGSSDAQIWYAIDDAVWLEPTPSHLGTTDTKLIRFPLSDYEYYQLTVNDSLSTPLNILRIGRYAPVASAGAYSAIPNLAFTQRDSNDKRTYIHLIRPGEARFDKLTIGIQATVSFRRRAEIGQFRRTRSRRGRVDRVFDVIRSVELHSADSNVVYLPGVKTKDLYLVIANDDNPPLTVERVQAYQSTTYLLANLTGGQAYQVRFSTDDVSAPAYDLTPFKAILPATRPIVGVGALTATGSTDEKTASFFTDRRMIWPALGLVLLLLGIMSYRMLREMGSTSN